MTGQSTVAQRTGHDNVCECQRLLHITNLPLVPPWCLSCKVKIHSTTPNRPKRQPVLKYSNITNTDVPHTDDQLSKRRRTLALWWWGYRRRGPTVRPWRPAASWAQGGCRTWRRPACGCCVTRYSWSSPHRRGRTHAPAHASSAAFASSSAVVLPPPPLPPHHPTPANNIHVHVTGSVHIWTFEIQGYLKNKFKTVLMMSILLIAVNKHWTHQSKWITSHSTNFFYLTKNKMVRPRWNADFPMSMRVIFYALLSLPPDSHWPTFVSLSQLSKKNFYWPQLN